MCIRDSGSTFGGNPLACEVAKKVVEIVSTQKVLKGVMKKTFNFHEQLNKLSEKFDLFEDIRSAGLWNNQSRKSFLRGS